ncbi:hypothetical protein QP166_18650 [Sphingomonas sp. LR60]|uniref:hypothetical protein n=1 Tax=Sphingomonas sp. LR60 TaxID=3050233 RepID=UPI002FDF704C
MTGARQDQPKSLGARHNPLKNIAKNYPLRAKHRGDPATPPLLAGVSPQSIVPGIGAEMLVVEGWKRQ